jgi:subtilisin family serine protease
MKKHNLIKMMINGFMITGIILGAIFGFAKTSQAYATTNQNTITQPNHTLPESQTGLYIVQLSDPSISMYAGGISGLAATSPQVTGAYRLDPKTPASQAYLAYVNAQQQNLISSLQTAFGHTIEVQYYYQYTLNAVAVRISHDEALQAFGLPGVKTVYADTLNQPDTDMGPTLIGAPSIWNGDTIGDIATKGEDIVVGMIDTGINHAHPSFAAVGPDGYTILNPYGDGVFHGDCLSILDFCNNKLIGAYDLYPGGAGGPEDTDGHGSHTSSTAAGDAHDAVFIVGTETFTRTISGVAPHANLVAYKICNPSCPDSASVAAVNLAIGTDEVDVINYSISGGDSPWTDTVDQAFLDAFAAGIFVSASAGNEGPGYGTVAHTGPWNSSVAASTHSRIIANTLDITSANGNLTGEPAVPGDVVVIGTDITGSILYAGDVDPSNILACDPFAAGSFDGKIGLAQRGTCTFATKITNLENAGAVGVVIFNNTGGPPTVMGAVPSTIPSVMITLDDGLAVVNLISGDPTAAVTIYAETQVIIDPAWQDIMASFSSRGPSQFELLKPDYTAPGVNILAAVAASGPDPVQYGFLQGTSMSSPHSAGAAALMMALRPGWTIAEVRSAMDSTADPTPVKDPNGVDPANPLEMGSGRLGLGGAGNAGLVMDETAADYQSANPDLGGDPKTLNQPSMVNYACTSTCTWTRILSSVVPTEDTWTVTTSGDPNLGITVTPNVFTLSLGETVTLTITTDVTAANAGDTLFGDVILTPTTASTAHLPVVVTAEAAPIISVYPTEIVSIQTAQLITKTLTINNQGNVDLTWNLYDGTPSQSWSDNFDSYATGSQLHGQGGWQGWDNSPAAGALTSDVQARSTPNSVAILGASDLTHPYTGYTSGLWTYTAWQYIPTDFSGVTYFILLNTYNDGGPYNWSLEVSIDSSTGLVTNDGPAGGTLPMIKGEWVEIRDEINLTTDTQSLYYGNDLLFTDSWTDGMSGGGVLNIANVDLFANSASVVYYDDFTLLPTGDPACGVYGDIPWLSTEPITGTTPAGESSPVKVLLDGTGFAPGVYTAELCAASNDLVTPLIPIPVTMTVVEGFNLYLPITVK